jgi:predicted nucleic acid-binding protein
MRLLDTNLLIRYLTNDIPVRANAVASLLAAVKAGAEQLYTTEVVVAEATFILSSKKTYNVSHAEIARLLSPILRLRGVTIPRKRVVIRALEIYGQNRKLDYSDALLVATAEQTGITTILSYDRDFDILPGIIRQEP